MSDIAAYYNLYSSLMNIWHKKYHNKIFHLNYDHFVENPAEYDETVRLSQPRLDPSVH